MASKTSQLDLSVRNWRSYFENPLRNSKFKSMQINVKFYHILNHCYGDFLCVFLMNY